MNEIEQRAYNWLINVCKYRPNEIVFQRTKTPDFITTDGKGYEAKKLYGAIVWFYSQQIERLKENQNNTVLVFNSGVLPKAIISSADLEAGKVIDGIRITVISNVGSSKILVDNELVERLKTNYPELTRLNATDVADWAMRKMLHYQICPPKKEA